MSEAEAKIVSIGAPILTKANEKTYSSFVCGFYLDSEHAYIMVPRGFYETGGSEVICAETEQALTSKIEANGRAINGILGGTEFAVFPLNESCKINENQYFEENVASIGHKVQIEGSDNIFYVCARDYPYLKKQASNQDTTPKTVYATAVLAPEVPETESISNAYIGRSAIEHAKEDAKDTEGVECGGDRYGVVTSINHRKRLLFVSSVGAARQKLHDIFDGIIGQYGTRVLEWNKSQEAKDDLAIVPDEYEDLWDPVPGVGTSVIETFRRLKRSKENGGHKPAPAPPQVNGEDDNE